MRQSLPNRSAPRAPGRAPHARPLRLALALASCAATLAVTGAPPLHAQAAFRPAARPAATGDHAVIPLPAELQRTGGDPFIVTDSTPVAIPAGADADVQRVGRFVATLISPGAVRDLMPIPAGAQPPARAITLGLDPRLAGVGDEGYQLLVAAEGARITARTAAGLFYGAQTLRQLLPAAIEFRAAYQRRLAVPAVRVTDTPRYEWRGLMLDVARHFLGPDDVKRFIDAMALYKLNRLHLHLADDQGWRLEIRKWPRLAEHGGSTQVGGGPGGYYTQAEYADLVAYARDRFVTIVPEIDMPGHTNAMLASIPELNCDGVAPPLYTGIRVGFSAVCASKEAIYPILDDIIGEIAALTPGPWFHVGGDEVEKLGHRDYLRFVERAERLVRKHGKRMIGWGEVAPAALDPSSLVQHWRTDAVASRDSAHLHAARGGRIIMSPANRTYLDMKYDSATVPGLRWAGLFDVRHAYEWNPAGFLRGVPDSAVVGVEAPLWAETVAKRSDYEYLAFPRLIAVAEVGWSPQASRRWEDFRTRLGAHGPRLQGVGVNFYRSPLVDWGR